MEHRYSTRRPVEVNAQLITHDGKCYPAQILELSAIGMRVVLKDLLPDRIKLVKIQLPIANAIDKAGRTLRMFVARKQGHVLGLCLVNENARINLEWAEPSSPNIRKLAL